MKIVYTSFLNEAPSPAEFVTMGFVVYAKCNAPIFLYHGKTRNVGVPVSCKNHVTKGNTEFVFRHFLVHFKGIGIRLVANNAFRHLEKIACFISEADNLFGEKNFACLGVVKLTCPDVCKMFGNVRIANDVSYPAANQVELDGDFGIFLFESGFDVGKEALYSLVELNAFPESLQLFFGDRVASLAHFDHLVQVSRDRVPVIVQKCLYFPPPKVLGVDSDTFQKTGCRVGGQCVVEVKNEGNAVHLKAILDEDSALLGSIPYTVYRFSNRFFSDWLRILNNIILFELLIKGAFIKQIGGKIGQHGGEHQMENDIMPIRHFQNQDGRCKG